MNKIKKGNLNYDQTGRAYPDNPEVKENWGCIWENNGKYYKIVGLPSHAEWDDVNLYDEIVNEAYENYRKLEFERIMSQNHGEYLMGKEEFINKIKTDDEFSEIWGFKIEERELSLEERTKLAKGKINEAYIKYLDYLNEHQIYGTWYDKKNFEKECKENKEFAKMWGLNIEERVLSLEERNRWFHINWNANNPTMKSDWKDYELDQQNVPTKLITITYNNEKIEDYD